MKTKQYEEVIQKHAVKPNYFKNALVSFFFGGLICVGGQLLIEMYIHWLGFVRETASTLALVTVILLASILTGLGVYDEFGQIAPVYSISAGIDYPGIGPEHASLHDSGRAQYVPITDDEAVEAFEYLAKMEGIIPAIESSHAIAYARKLAPTMDKDQIIVVTVSGRGDKDCAAIARYRGEEVYE